MMKRRNIKTAAMAAALAGVLCIGGIMAYFTDGDTATNIFTVGDVSIDLQEPNWTPPTDITPKQEIEKDPQIKNDGKNDAYVFMEVVVPYKNVTTVNDDGTKNPKADTELFSYAVNPGWFEMGSGQKDTAKGTVTHLYAYGSADAMTTLTKGQNTPALFNKVRFANVIEDELLEGTQQNIVINSYAIQTTNINDGKVDIDGNNADGKTRPEDVWAVLSKQEPVTNVTEPEDPNTDIKQPVA